MAPNFCGICREERDDLISLKFIDEAEPIIRKLKRFIDRIVSRHINEMFSVHRVVKRNVLFL